MTANVVNPISEMITNIDENCPEFPRGQIDFDYKPRLTKRPRLSYNYDNKTQRENSVPKGDYLLEPQNIDNKGKKTLVLDLDETLVHSSLTYSPACTFVSPIMLDEIEYHIYVSVRPFAKEIISILSKFYEIVIFTASMRQYAENVIDFIDPQHKTLRLYRDACVRKNAHFVKDLSKLGRDLKQTIIIDNSPECIELQPENGILISSWIDSQSDVELLQLHDVLLSEPFLNSEDITETIKSIGCA